MAAFTECLEERRKLKKTLKATASSRNAEEGADEPEQEYVKKCKKVEHDQKIESIEHAQKQEAQATNTRGACGGATSDGGGTSGGFSNTHYHWCQDIPVLL